MVFCTGNMWLKLKATVAHLVKSGNEPVLPQDGGVL
jgi:hypothetical protein